MKFNYFLCFVLFVVFCVCCNPPVKEIGGIKYIQQEELAKVDFLRLGDDKYFKSCFAVKLEAGEESLINEINQLEIAGERIYILDIKKSQLMVFDLTGKYLYNIGKQGNGPEEYLYISAFYIDQDIINILDPMHMSVFQYDQNGNFISRIKHSNMNLSFIKKIIPINNNQLFVYSGTNWEDNAMYSVIDKTNYKTITNIRCYPEKNMSISYAYSRQPFWFFDDKIIFGTLFSDTISVYKQDYAYPEMIIENKQNIPQKLLKQKLWDNNNDYSLVIRDLHRENNYNTGILNVFENNRFFLCDFKYGHCISAILYDKFENNTVLIKNYCHHYPDFGDYFTGFDNTLVRLWNHDMIEAFKDELEREENKRENYPQSILDIIDHHNADEDNPVLLFYEFNEYFDN